MTSNRVRAFTLLLLFAILAACTQFNSTLANDPAAPQHPGLPEGAEVELYLLIGQSNMAGRGRLVETSASTHPRVFMLDRDNLWRPARDPLHFDKPTRLGVGPGLSFGIAMAEAHPDTIIGLIPSAVGGSRIDAWKPGGYHGQTDVYPYDAAAARTRAALESDGRLKAILWHQGEADSRRDRGPYYGQALSALAANLRRDLDAPKIPILVGGLGDFLLRRNTDAAQVQNSLKDAPKTIQNLIFVSAKGLKDKGDELHFDSASYRELGRRYATALLEFDKGSMSAD